MNLLIAVVIIGFVVCGLLLRQIRTYLHYCLLKLGDIESTADDARTDLSLVSSALDEIKQHIEERFPTPQEHDPLL
ncbi:MAG: hypothetical protein WA252_10125 [Candidatus Sulfotelmatobacter sp.]